MHLLQTDHNMAANANHDGIWDGLGHQFLVADDNAQYHDFIWPAFPPYDLYEPSSIIDPLAPNCGFRHQAPLMLEYDDAVLGLSHLGLSEDGHSVFRQEDEHTELFPPLSPFDMLSPPAQPVAPIPKETQRPEERRAHAPRDETGAQAKSKRFGSFRRSPKKASPVKKERKAPNPRFQCPRCEFGGTDTRSLRRHIWAEHEDYAEKNKIPSEKEKCKFPGCKYWARKDNVLRHWKKRHCNGAAE